MRTSILLATLSALTSVEAGTRAASLLATPSFQSPHIDPHTHANDIFNAIHSSMRQFGSSLNHNGMAFYIATVPQGTELYHGTSYAYCINDTEWLAFEAEHALLFASRGRRGHPDHIPPVSANDPQHQHQVPLAVARLQEAEQREPRGYLHTYTTKRPLRVLYLDGQSAAKSSFGTLDTQDVIIRGGKDSDSSPSGEYTRAQDLCRIARETWAGSIDGILRMEGGFELILCSFSGALDVADIKQVYSPNSLDHHAYYEAVASRYDGIGGGRVTVDYSRFVTMFALPNATYVDAEGRSRLFKNSSRVSEARRMLRDLVLSGTVPESDAINWQDVVDMYVSRWSDRLEYLFTLLEDERAFKDQLSTMLRPYIDNAQRNPEAEIERCRRQYWPETKENSLIAKSLAAQAIAEVVSKMCRDLWTAEAALANHHFRAATHTVAGLKIYLSWTTWKRCRGCMAHEICKLPIWPMGNKEDFIQPQCNDFLSGGSHGTYWERFGSPHASGRRMSWEVGGGD